MTEATLPASWYPDPRDASRLRWWDGLAWTEHVKELPPPPPPVAGAPVSAILDAFVIKTTVPESRSWNAETGNRYVPIATIHEQATEERDANDDFDKLDDTGSGWTVESWLMALLPAVGFALWVFLARLNSGEIFLETPVLFWAVPAVFIVLGPVLGAMDHGTLAARNVPNLPSPFIAILPPAYLLIRAINVGASSVLPLIIWSGLVVALYNPARSLILGFLWVLSTR